MAHEPLVLLTFRVTTLRKKGVTKSLLFAQKVLPFCLFSSHITLYVKFYLFYFLNLRVTFHNHFYIYPELSAHAFDLFDLVTFRFESLREFRLAEGFLSDLFAVFFVVLIYGSDRKFFRNRELLQVTADTVRLGHVVLYHVIYRVAVCQFPAVCLYSLQSLEAEIQKIGPSIFSAEFFVHLEIGFLDFVVAWDDD